MNKSKALGIISVCGFAAIAELPAAWVIAGITSVCILFLKER